MNKDKNIYLKNSNIEIINQKIMTGMVRFVIFDFDGTISLIREGWQQIMLPMMVNILMQTPKHEDRPQVESIVREFVDKSTGKQTIYQMIHLVEEITKRGGSPKTPLDYKNRYHDLLMEHINGRLDGLRNGKYTPDDWMVPGSISVLQELHDRNITCFLASGTDEKYVIDEADLLGVSPYFAGIYGALDDYKSFSKRMVIERIIKENKCKGPELIAFGDGYVEIEDTKSAGGIAIGVATNESERHGIDEWKRNRLISSGADIIIPDFNEWRQLIQYLLQTS